MSASALHDLVTQLAADGSLSEDDLRQIGAAMAGTADRLVASRGMRALVASTAHVHKVRHAPVVTAHAAFKGQAKDEWPEDVDASHMVCHDCGRGLINDIGTAPLLLCPQVHGLRPTELDPAEGQAVECGVKP